MSSDKDSLGNTLKVAIGLSLVCSVIVSVFAVGLRGMQDANKERYRKRNILEAAQNLLVGDDGTLDYSKIDGLYETHIEARFVDLATGETLEAPYRPEGSNESFEPDAYDLKAASKDPAITVEIPEGDNIAGLQGGEREGVSVVYLVKSDSGELLGYVLPIRGYGLWSTLWGFIALEADGETIRGLTYYEQKETPGLGGEVDNPSWKAKWNGKKVHDPEGDVAIEVVKAAAEGPYEVDGLAGATITSRGVTNMLKYWLGPQGFGPFLEKHAKGGSNG